MSRLLRLSSVLLVVAALLWWGAAGARLGWWQTRVGVERTDEFTGLTVVEWQERFVPGVETPLVGLLLGGALFAGSFLFRRKASTNNQTTT
ncbi:MAG TPA: hypothetical protein VK178_03190 [Opitutaceae bacterium]|nr:hypothetical protein [Opitutaceae bacterium]